MRGWRAMTTTIPPEAVDFLREAARLNDSKLGIHVLDAAASSRQTEQMRGISVCDRLGLVVLDDANDSNPYCYITKGATAGIVVHFSHDPEPRIKFVSLEAFRAFLASLRDTRQELWSVEIPSPAHPQQGLLAAHLGDLAAQALDDAAEFLICLYLPLVRGDASSVLARFLASESFFVREAVAEVIGTARLSDSRDLLKELREDKHPQVRKAAERASKVWRV